MSLSVSIKNNPFYILKATPKDNVEALAQKYKLALAEANYEHSFTVSEAYKTLCEAEAYLKSVLTWIVNIDFSKMQELLQQPKAPLPPHLNLLEQANITLNRLLIHTKGDETTVQTLLGQSQQLWERLLNKNVDDELLECINVCLVGSELKPISKTALSRELRALYNEHIDVIFEAIKHANFYREWVSNEHNRIKPDDRKRVGVLRDLMIRWLSDLNTQYQETVLSVLKGTTELWRMRDFEKREQLSNKITEGIKHAEKVHAIFFELMLKAWDNDISDEFYQNKREFIEQFITNVDLQTLKQAGIELDKLKDVLGAGEANLIKIDNYKQAVAIATIFSEKTLQSKAYEKEQVFVINLIAAYERLFNYLYTGTNALRIFRENATKQHSEAKVTRLEKIVSYVSERLHYKQISQGKIFHPFIAGVGIGKLKEPMWAAVEQQLQLETCELQRYSLYLKAFEEVDAANADPSTMREQVAKLIELGAIFAAYPTTGVYLTQFEQRFNQLFNGHAERYVKALLTYAAKDQKVEDIAWLLLSQPYLDRFIRGAIKRDYHIIEHLLINGEGDSLADLNAEALCRNRPALKPFGPIFALTLIIVGILIFSMGL